MPYDNTLTVYTGSDNDDAMNDGVARYVQEPSAVNYMEHYYTPTGDLHVPVLTLHKVRDPLIPNFHETIYAGRVADAGASTYLLQRTGRWFRPLWISCRRNDGIPGTCPVGQDRSEAAELSSGHGFVFETDVLRNAPTGEAGCGETSPRSARDLRQPITLTISISGSS